VTEPPAHSETTAGGAHAPAPHPLTSVPLSSPESLQVLYEDHHLVVVNKPAPLLTQAPPGVPNLEERVKAYLKAKFAKPGGVYLGVPHRLDRPVSGAVCFARNTKAAQRVHAQFEAHTVRKVYWALVEGAVSPESGVWDDWVRKVENEPRAERAAEGDPGAKLATLEYRVLKRLDGLTLLELHPLTGRMHQLRVQTAWRGHPVRGDALYGSPRPFGPPAESPRDQVIALHARRLTIAHPFTKAELTVEAPVPDYWGAGFAE
jgi:23S rRNA pseudouridine1911/1915/1917 synthase